MGCCEMSLNYQTIAPKRSRLSYLTSMMTPLNHNSHAREGCDTRENYAFKDKLK